MMLGHFLNAPLKMVLHKRLNMHKCMNMHKRINMNRVWLCLLYKCTLQGASSTVIFAHVITLLSVAS